VGMVYIHKIFCFFFLNVDLIVVLKNIHYAKSIQILNTLVNGSTYIQPPVIVIEYDEISLSDIGKGTLVEVRIKILYVFI
jgi:hypothetical protein